MADEPNKEDAIRLVKGGFSAVLEEQALNCAVPIFWYDQQATPESRILANGTMFFLQLPDALVGVTANHVYQDYLDTIDRSPSACCRLHQIEFDFSSRLLDRSAELDLATFKITEEDLSELDRTAHTPPQEWPPNPIQ